jgi:hypothetical protein
LREFDRIARQIQHDLAQAGAIAHQHGWNVGRNVGGDLKTLALRARSQQFGDPLHQRRDFERHIFKIKMTSLNARQVENFIQQTNQRRARAPDRLIVGALLLIEPAKREEIGKSDDPAERRADFMAHHRQKPRLGRAGFFRRRSRLLQSADLGQQPGVLLAQA